MSESQAELPTPVADPNRLPVTLSLRWFTLLLSALVIAAAVVVAFFRKPPYGIGRWEWYIEPLLISTQWRLTGACSKCGMKGIHKRDCSEGR